MLNHGNTIRMDDRSSVAALSGRRNRIKENVIRGNAIVRDAFRLVLQDLKGGDARKPRPEEIAQKIGDTLRDASHPCAEFHEIIAVMKEDGLSLQSARVFAAKISVGYVDAIYADLEIPAPEIIGPQLVVEEAQATAAEMVADRTKNPVDYSRALDERHEALALATIKLRALQARCISPFRSAVVR